jgi:hypothetical protein
MNLKDLHILLHLVPSLSRTFNSTTHLDQPPFLNPSHSTSHPVNVQHSSAHPVLEKQPSQLSYNRYVNLTKIGGKDVNEVDVGWLHEHVGVEMYPNELKSKVYLLNHRLY